MPVRPTTDFAKTGLFNILSTHYNFAEINVLDLFAGAGSISYEFLSRGCTNVQCVDRNAKCVQYIKQMMQQLRAPSLVKVALADAVTYLSKNGEQFNIIFADPPFELEIADELVSTTFENKKLKTQGTLIIEHASGKKYDTLPYFVESRKYGHVSFSFFKE